MYAQLLGLQMGLTNRGKVRWELCNTHRMHFPRGISATAAGDVTAGSAVVPVRNAVTLHAAGEANGVVGCGPHRFRVCGG